MAVKVYRKNSTVAIEGTATATLGVYLNPDDIMMEHSSPTTLKIYDKNTGLTYELGTATAIQDEDGNAWGATKAAVIDAITGFLNVSGSVGSGIGVETEIVNAADIGAVDDTWVDQGSEIDLTNINGFNCFIDLTVNDSTGNQIQVLLKRENGGSEEYILETAADYQKTIGDANINILYPFDTEGVISAQLQTKATDVDTGGGTEATITITIIKY